MSRIEEPQKEESLVNGLAVADQRIQVTYSFTELESGKVSAISTAQRGWPSIFRANLSFMPSSGSSGFPHFIL